MVCLFLTIFVSIAVVSISDTVLCSSCYVKCQSTVTYKHGYLHCHVGARATDLDLQTMVVYLQITVRKWLRNHVNDICKYAYHQMRYIRQISRQVDKDWPMLCPCICQMKIQLLHGIHHIHLDMHMRVQNTAARLMTWCRMRDHITPVLKELYWRPVRQRIAFKKLEKMSTNHSIVWLHCTYKNVYQPERTLRSAGQQQMVEPSAKTEHMFILSLLLLITDKTKYHKEGSRDSAVQAQRLPMPLAPSTVQTATSPRTLCQDTIPQFNMDTSIITFRRT